MAGQPVPGLDLKRSSIDGSTYVDFTGRAGDYEIVPFHKVLSGEIAVEYFQDRIVLIGPYAVGVTDDRYLTALDHQDRMYGIEIHANILQAFLHNKFKERVPDWVNILVIVILALLAYIVFRLLSLVRSSAVLGITFALYAVTAKILYTKGFVLSLVYPLALLLTMYIAMIAYHYIKEYLERRRITGIFSKYVAPQVVREILKGGEESL